MFQGLLENLIKSLIGEYVEEIDSKKLNLSVSSSNKIANSTKTKYQIIFNFYFDHLHQLSH